MRAKISVICPTFHAAAYIERTLSCLLSQTRPPDEVVFSDDGSTDDTVRILETWRARFVAKGIGFKLLCHDHQGPGHARNVGIKNASGDWIAFLDADDIWADHKLARVCEEMCAWPEVDFFLHWETYVKMDGTEDILKHGESYTVGQDLKKSLYRSNFFSTSACVCRKKILLAAGGFDHSLPSSQDYELWLKVSPVITLRVIPEVLGSYVELPQSITARHYYRRYIPLMRVLVRHRDKGGWGLFVYRALRATLSRQWFTGIFSLMQGRKGHY